MFVFIHTHMNLGDIPFLTYKVIWTEHTTCSYNSFKSRNPQGLGVCLWHFINIVLEVHL